MKTKQQPTAAQYREQLRLAADEIIRLRDRPEVDKPAVGIVFAAGMLAGVVLSAVSVWL